MGIRKPIANVLDYDDASNVGATSVAGGVAKTFTLPQDTDNVTVKLTASIVGGGVSVVFQTTDDAGTTWYDVARSSIVSNANNTTAQFLSIPVMGMGVATSYVPGTVPSVGGQAAASILVATGNAAASSIGQLGVTGLPLMDTFNRVFIRYTAGVSANALARVQVRANSQSVGH